MLPAAASFQKQGANKGAIAAFLVSTPESGIDSIAITYALLDPIMTVVRPVAAFITGIAAGVLENSITFGRQEKTAGSARPEIGLKVIAPVCADGHVPSGSFRSKVVVGMKYAFGDVWGDIVFWFFGGLVLAGVITVLIPERLSELVLGGGLISMLAMLVVGMPVYICATASTPIAAALLLKGASPGAVLVFLLAGPATNMTSMSVLFRLLGKAGTVRYLLVIAASAVLFGLGLDGLYRFFAIEPKAIIEETREILPPIVKFASALLLIVLSLYHGFLWLRKTLRRRRQQVFTAGFPAVNSGRRQESAEQPGSGK